MLTEATSFYITFLRILVLKSHHNGISPEVLCSFGRDCTTYTRGIICIHLFQILYPDTRLTFLQNTNQEKE
jgi:hypothetical protein